ncbi:MAG TPA: CotH kinase family protein, partial [Ignavibacteriales bacterium]|nr:CotH kinase family protein [Ignavibacteriales bacterium]
MRLKFYCMLSLASLFVFSSAPRPQDLQKPAKSASEFTSSDLPIIIINTNGQEIIDDPKITADMGIIDNGSARNNVTDSFNGYNGKIGIELRGSTSQDFPKKPYAVELRDTLGADLEASLLGMAKNEDWILYATYNDKTFMRDILIYKLACQLGWYASRTRYCELVLNGEYMGVYVLMEKIKRGKNRVNIAKMDTTCISGDELTG